MVRKNNGITYLLGSWSRSYSSSGALTSESARRERERRKIGRRGGWGALVALVRKSTGANTPAWD